MEKFSKAFDLENHESACLTLDIETTKIRPIVRPVWESGEVNGLRWQTVMIGVAFCDASKATIRIFVGEESEIMEESFDFVKFSLNTNLKIQYNSRNRFDEGLLMGRFINGRRPLTKLPSKQWVNWSSFEGASDLKWEQVRGASPISDAFRVSRPDLEIDSRDFIYGNYDVEKGVNHLKLDLVGNLERGGVSPDSIEMMLKNMF